MFLKIILPIPLILVVIQSIKTHPKCDGQCIDINDLRSMRYEPNPPWCEKYKTVCSPNPTEPVYITRSQIACLNYSNDRSLCPDHTLIKDAKIAIKNEFQYMTSIGYYNDTLNIFIWTCGGTLIHSRFVLTAAHCFQFERSPKIKQPDFYVRLGAHTYTDGIIYSVANISYHEKRNISQNTYDISILRLNDTVIFNEKIKPACLPTTTVEYDDILTLSGWGEDSKTPIETRQLHKTYLRILKATDCENGKPDLHLCTIGVNNISNACRGDSGGPLSRWHPEWGSCLGEVMGIASAGNSCNANFTKILYTNVLTYLNWIEDIVWPTND